MKKTILVIGLILIGLFLFGCDEPICGNGICERGEDSQSCLSDCGQIGYCGDGLCNNTETSTSCPKDCNTIENLIFGKWYSIPTPGTSNTLWDINETNATLTDFDQDLRVVLDINYYDESKISLTGTYDLQFDYTIETISDSEKILTLIHPFNYQRLINKPKNEIRDYEYCGNLYCGEDENANTCLADCEHVEFNTVMENGENKINLLFVFNKYLEQSLIEEDIEKFVDVQGDYNGLFAYSPLKENIDKFNVYYTDFNLNCYPTENIQDGSGEDCVNKANHLSVMKNATIVAVILDMEGISQLGLGGSNRITMSRLAGPVGEEFLATKMLVHEFGHAFANLGDEYTNYGATTDLSNRPNVDVIGCPKWCSGELNTTVPRFNDFNNFMACVKEFTNNFKDYYMEDSYTGACGINPAQYSFEENNLGIGCQEGTGCYWNAKGIINYRSSQNSLMKYWEVADGFNEISRKAIQKRINELVS